MAIKKKRGKSVIVSFSGVDGSGKSTCARWAGEFLESQGFRVITHHFFAFSLYSHLGKILSFLSPEKAERIAEDQYSKEKGRTFKNKILLVIRLACLIFDIIFFKLIFLNFSKKDATCYVFDRFFMDQVVQLCYLNAIGNRLIAIFLRYSILSDIPILLKLDFHEAMRRKPEFPSEYFERKSHLCNSLTSNNKVITIENRDRQETQRRIGEILKGFLEHGKI